MRSQLLNPWFTEEKLSPDVFRLRVYVEKFISENSELSESKKLEIIETLAELDRESKTDVWCDGACLADIGYVLSVKFRQLSLSELEDAAVTIWARATLNVCSHYRHLVGPAMIALAEMYRRKGDLDSAKGCFEAVMLDFESELNVAETDGFRDSDHIKSLNSLVIALSRLTELETGKSKKKRCEKMLLRANKVLSFSKT